MLSHPFSDRPSGSQLDETRTMRNQSELPKKRLIFSDHYNFARIVIDWEEFVNLYYEQLTTDNTEETLILNTLRTQITETDEIEVDKLLKDLNITSDFLMGDAMLHFLNTGRVSLYDIKNNKYVQKYMVHDSGFLGGPLFGGDSIEYRLPGAGGKDDILFFTYGWRT